MTDAFGPADQQLLDAIRTHDEGLRALLCTLARHGLGMKRATPQLAQRWIDELAPHPYYKGGQFLFDLLEWEDFMLDGAPPPVLDAAAACRMLDRLAASLRGLVTVVDRGPAAGLEAVVAPGGFENDRLPELASKDYLFPCVVLGALTLFKRSPAVPATS
jgi:hypothetical protein